MRRRTTSRRNGSWASWSAVRTPDLAKAAFPEAQLVYLNTLADLKVALESGKIDGYLVEKYDGLMQVAEDDQLWLTNCVVANADCGIGFTKAQTFLRITLPQAARHFLPVFRGEFISLVTTTSVVGYISIMDLTKMSDIIRSRTYEAFFPLIATAVIYFALSWLLARVLTTPEKRIDPKRRKRTIKGVREGGAAC